MQNINIEVEDLGGTIAIRVGISKIGKASVPELLAYTDVLQQIKLLLFAVTGVKGIQESIDAAEDMTNLMEKITAVRVMGDDTLITSSGETFTNELESLFERHDGDQMDACRELLGRLGEGHDFSVIDEDVVRNALSELAQKIMNGELGKEEKVDAPGIPRAPVFFSN